MSKINSKPIRKRYRISNPRRFTAFVCCTILILVFAGGTLLGLYDASSKDAVSYTTICVEAGDTLWNLARTYGPKNQDVRMTVYQICKLNNVSAETLQAGQYITIPN